MQNTRLTTYISSLLSSFFWVLKILSIFHTHFSEPGPLCSWVPTLHMLKQQVSPTSAHLKKSWKPGVLSRGTILFQIMESWTRLGSLGSKSHCDWPVLWLEALEHNPQAGGPWSLPIQQWSGLLGKQWIKMIFKIPSQLKFYYMKFLFLYRLLNVGGSGNVEQAANNLKTYKPGDLGFSQRTDR